MVVPCPFPSSLPHPVAQSLKSRLASATLLNSSYFYQQPFVQAMVFLESMALKTPVEKEAFFKETLTSLPTWAPACLRAHFLPQLRTAVELGAAVHPLGLAAILTCLKTLGPSPAESSEAIELATVVTPMLLKMYAANERSMRVSLLQALPEYVELLTEGVVNDTVLPSVVTGFTDTMPQMREVTVKSMLFFAPKLTDKSFTSVVLPQLDRLQMDKEAPIRTNTTICLGKIAP